LGGFTSKGISLLSCWSLIAPQRMALLKLCVLLAHQISPSATCTSLDQANQSREIGDWLRLEARSSSSPMMMCDRSRTRMKECADPLLKARPMQLPVVWFLHRSWSDPG